MRRIAGWLRQGWCDFRATTAVSAGFSALFALLGVATIWTLALQGYGLLVYPFATGFLLVAPVLLTGYQRVARLLRQGQRPGAGDLLRGIGEGTPGIWFLTFILVLCYLIWVTDALVIYAIYFDFSLLRLDGMQGISAAQLDGLLTYLLFSGVMGLFFALLSFAISIFSVPLIMHGKLHFIAAILSSVRMVFRHFPLMLMWGLCIAGLVLVALVVLPLMVVVLPVVAYASYAAFADLYPEYRVEV